MRILVSSLVVAFLLSGCSTTGLQVKGEEPQVVTSQYPDLIAETNLKCQCGSSFSQDDVYFP